MSASIDIRHGDCRHHLAEMPEASVDSCVTDPPYGLGFMGKGWDRGVPGVEFWAAVLRVLKPGGHLLAFSGTRTQHRMVCAIEDAGFEIRDQIGWAYGSGFPKSHNLPGGRGTALKPAWEPICVARRPLVGTVAANVQAHGTGALNIDGCRIPPVDDADIDQQRRVVGFGKSYGNGEAGIALAGSADGSLHRRDRAEFDPTRGRWPANLINDGSDEVLGLMGEAARFFYSAKADKGDRLGSKHPTVKPVDLMAYLCRLVTPPGGVVLDPFAGSGTTGMAAMREGFSAVLIELEAESVADIRRRIAHVQGADTPLFAPTEPGLFP